MLQRALTFLAVVLIVKITVSVLLGYRDYLPPNFDNDFLSGREAYFFGAYRWAFYAHLFAGPASLVLGLILVSERLRLRWPKWHRSLGKVQAAIVLWLTPSGLWMAWYAQTGFVATIGFFLLAIATGICVLLGWRAAVKRRFIEHRRWMMRCFLLLCSAVVLRMIGGLVTVTGIGVAWGYPLASWASWLVPLAAFECAEVLRRRARRNDIHSGAPSATAATVLALPAMEILKSSQLSSHLPFSSYEARHVFESSSESIAALCESSPRQLPASNFT
jgi:hypothetical protein